MNLNNLKLITFLYSFFGINETIQQSISIPLDVCTGIFLFMIRISKKINWPQKITKLNNYNYFKLVYYISKSFSFGSNVTKGIYLCGVTLIRELPSYLYENRFYISSEVLKWYLNSVFQKEVRIQLDEKKLR